MFELLPGYILYKTRLRSLRAAIGYVWLEFGPISIALAWVGMAVTIRFIIFQLVFIGLYELGYFYNDAAVTQRERVSSERSILLWPLRRMAIAITARVVYFCALIGLLAYSESVSRSLLYALVGCAVVLMLFVHTWVGVRHWANGPLRCLIFGWLAGTKYLAALMACTPWREALALSFLVFISYGGGRVIEYAIRKHNGVIYLGVMDVNMCWYLLTLPWTAWLCSGMFGPFRIWSVLVTIGLYHACAAVVRWSTVATASRE
jgi:hypothetical protein